MTPEELKFAAEYHRGFEDGKAVRDASQWQLELQRKVVVARLRKVVPSELHGSHEMLSAICKAIQESAIGWTAGACESLRDRLIYLLGGENHKLPAEPDAESAKNGENHQLVGCDVLVYERHKAACNIAEIRSDAGGFVKALAKALDIDWQAPRVSRNIALICKQLIYLLDGTQDAPNATDFAGNRQNGPKSGEKAPEMQRDQPKSRDSLQEVEPPSITDERHKAVAYLLEWEPDKAFANDNMGEIHIRILYQLLGLGGAMMMDGADAAKAVRDRLIHLLGGECNFSGAESDTDAQDDAANPAETPEEQGNHVISGTHSSITDELRRFAQGYKYEWLNVKDGTVTFTTADGAPDIDSVNMRDYICSIADRIDAQYAKLEVDYKEMASLQKQFFEEMHKINEAYDALGTSAHG